MAYRMKCVQGQSYIFNYVFKVSWIPEESRIRLFIKGKKHVRMMIDSIDNGPLVYPTVEENGQTRPMKYSELTEAQQLQDNCDVQATNIILHGLPPDVKLSNSIQSISVSTTFRFFNQGEDLIECINKAMAFLSGIASRFPPSNNQLRTSSNLRNEATIQDGRVITEDLDAYDSNYDDLSSAKAVLMENLSSCDLEVLSEVPYSDSYPNDMINQDVQEMQYSEQTHIDNFQDNEIHSDSKIILYS
nr:hypothetical protein [Tanacetum cinerariifolium]